MFSTHFTPPKALTTFNYTYELELYPLSAGFFFQLTAPCAQWGKPWIKMLNPTKNRTTLACLNNESSTCTYRARASGVCPVTMETSAESHLVRGAGSEGPESSVSVTVWSKAAITYSGKTGKFKMSITEQNHQSPRKYRNRDLAVSTCSWYTVGQNFSTCSWYTVGQNFKWSQL